MSLINKMLQDLDARGGSSGPEVMRASVKSVVHDEPGRPPALIGGVLVLVLLALCAGGWYGWRTLRPAAPSAPPVKTVLLAPPLVVQPAPAPVAPPADVVGPEAPPPAAKPKAGATAREKRLEQRKARREEKLTQEAAAKASASAGGPQSTVQQRAESEYRRALATLQEGRALDAIASLEQAVQVDPRHEAARQTLVGLLIENKRPDDAMRQLQLALSTEPRQPAMAMLLARMQIERGASGIDTLQRTLPYAAGSAEYHAFLAGALQRQQRHREAAEQYQAALRTHGQNGVWLMGLGISLQAEKRNAEALDAFQKAKSSANLSSELQAFVDRKLQQLSH